MKQGKQPRHWIVCYLKHVASTIDMTKIGLSAVISNSQFRNECHLPSWPCIMYQSLMTSTLQVHIVVQLDHTSGIIQLGFIKLHRLFADLGAHQCSRIGLPKVSQWHATVEQEINLLKCLPPTLGHAKPDENTGRHHQRSKDESNAAAKPGVLRIHEVRD
jgi:hypothetical protein